MALDESIRGRALTAATPSSALNTSSNSRGVRNAVVAVVVFLATTNLYSNPVDDRAVYVSGFDDSFSYLSIAEAAPLLPDTVVRFHHAQRLAIPYAIGLAHDATGIGIHTLFLTVACVLGIGILMTLVMTLADLGVPAPVQILLLAIFGLNPWTYRPYLAFPELVDDLGFVFGLAVLVRGLTAGRPALVIGGQVVASLSRQTGLLLIPMVLLWLWQENDVRQSVSSRRRIFSGAAAASVAIVIYLATSSLAAGFGTSNVNGEHLVGVWRWAQSSFDARALAKFLVAAAEPIAILAILFIAFVFLARRSPPRKVWILIVGAGFIWAQPLLAGPEITGGNIQRLITLGLVPMVIAVAIILRDVRAFSSPSKATAGICAMSLLLASLHHHYVSTAIPYSDDNRASIAFFAVAVFVLAGVTVVEARRVRAEISGRSDT